MNLHGQIMNIQAGDPGLEPTPERAYELGHRDALHAAAELALKADAVIEAARSVLVWRVDTPTRGDLRDNDQSRDALRTLADAVNAVNALEAGG